MFDTLNCLKVASDGSRQPRCTRAAGHYDGDRCAVDRTPLASPRASVLAGDQTLSLCCSGWVRTALFSPAGHCQHPEEARDSREERCSQSGICRLPAVGRGRKTSFGGRNPSTRRSGSCARRVRFDGSALSSRWRRNRSRDCGVGRRTPSGGRFAAAALGWLRTVPTPRRSLLRITLNPAVIACFASESAMNSSPTRAFPRGLARHPPTPLRAECSPKGRGPESRHDPRRSRTCDRRGLSGGRGDLACSAG